MQEISLKLALFTEIHLPIGTVALGLEIRCTGFTLGSPAGQLQCSWGGNVFPASHDKIWGSSKQSQQLGWMVFWKENPIVPSAYGE